MKIYIVGQMCSGKTTFSKIFKELGLSVFHLDHIRQDIPLTDAYKEAFKSDIVEGYTPFRLKEHWEAIKDQLNGVKYILIAPPYEKWRENCKPIIACPTDENPPNYTKEEYEAENNRLKELTKPIIII
jgi:hypothetical protein